MSTFALANDLATSVTSHAHVVLADAVNLNPRPQPPEGMGKPVTELMGYIKWGVLVVIVGTAFIGAGALAGGHVVGHRKSSQVGQTMLLAAVLAAAVFAGIYAFVTHVAGS